MAERSGEAADVLGAGEGDDHHLAARPLDLKLVLTQELQVLLTEKAAEMAQQDQDGRPAEQSTSREGRSLDVEKLEIEIDVGHPSSKVLRRCPPHPGATAGARSAPPSRSPCSPSSTRPSTPTTGRPTPRSARTRTTSFSRTTSSAS